MHTPAKLKVLIALLIISIFGIQSQAVAQKSEGKKARSAATPVLWEDPGNVSARDLRYGPGSAQLAPVPPFTFIEEDKSGESPKFEVKDARGVLWKVKLGPEAQSETVSTRLVWSVGYFAEEAYYFNWTIIQGLPRLSRGREYVGHEGIVSGPRFEPRRDDVKRGEEWDWNDNPFQGTRELSGLKVLMILLNNFDARAPNNSILYIKNDPRVEEEARYVVTDLGATLGKADGFGGRRTKNNLKDFLSTRFVLGVEDGVVEFDFDTRPTNLGAFAILYPPYYRDEVKKEKVMRGIPIEHARWIGGLLSQLTDEQLRDAFRAASYRERTMEEYVRSLRSRINQLARL